jgi:serine/threonine-protein kinase HipA
MPLRSGPVAADRLLPWLANLLPETHLTEIGQRLKVSPQDIVRLLSHIGRDTAGA